MKTDLLDLRNCDCMELAPLLGVTPRRPARWRQRVRVPGHGDIRCHGLYRREVVASGPLNENL